METLNCLDNSAILINASYKLFADAVKNLSSTNDDLMDKLLTQVSFCSNWKILKDYIIEFSIALSEQIVSLKFIEMILVKHEEYLIRLTQMEDNDKKNQIRITLIDKLKHNCGEMILKIDLDIKEVVRLSNSIIAEIQLTKNADLISRITSMINNCLNSGLAVTEIAFVAYAIIMKNELTAEKIVSFLNSLATDLRSVIENDHNFKVLINDFLDRYKVEYEFDDEYVISLIKQYHLEFAGHIEKLQNVLLSNMN